jgi:hypothetical protein
MLLSSSTVKMVGTSHKKGTTNNKSKAPFLPTNCNKGSNPYGPPETVRKIIATNERGFNKRAEEVGGRK